MSRRGFYYWACGGDNAECGEIFEPATCGCPRLSMETVEHAQIHGDGVWLFLWFVPTRHGIEREPRIVTAVELIQQSDDGKWEISNRHNSMQWFAEPVES